MKVKNVSLLFAVLLVAGIAAVSCNRDTPNNARGEGGIFGRIAESAVSGGSAVIDSADSAGGIGWSRIDARELPPDGTWTGTYAMSLIDGIDMDIVHTFTIAGNKPVSNVMKQTLSGANVSMIWPMLKMSYEMSGIIPGTHRVNDTEHSIETTYDPNDPIFSGGAFEDSDSGDDLVNVYINAARNRIRIIIDNDMVPDIEYVRS